MLVYYIRKYQKEKNSLEEAIRKAIDRCIEEDYLKQYLLKKKAEVTRLKKHNARKEGDALKK